MSGSVCETSAVFGLAVLMLSCLSVLGGGSGGDFLMAVCSLYSEMMSTIDRAEDLFMDPGRGFK